MVIANLKYLYKYLWSCKRSDKTSILLALFISIFVIIINTSIPIYFKYFIDKFHSKNQISVCVVLLMAIGYGVFWTLGNLLGRLRSTLTYKAVLRCLSLMIEGICESFLKWNDCNEKSNNMLGLTERLNQHVPKLVEGLVWQIGPILLETIFALIIIIKYTDIYISLVLFSTIFLYLIYLIISFEKISFFQTQTISVHDGFLDILADLSHNIEIIKLFNGQKISKNKLRSLLYRKEIVEQKTDWQIERTGSMQFLVIGVGLTALTCMLGLRIIDSTYLISDLILVHTYLIQLTLPLSHFGFVINGIQKGIIVIDEARALNTSDLKEDMPSLTMKASHKKNINIIFKDLTVEINGMKILNRVNFTIHSGESTAIIGRSGNGKTSLVKVLTKFLPITEGDLYINDQSIQNIPINELYSFFSVSPQENKVFHETILFNINYGNTEVDLRKINKILKIVNLYDRIKKLPKGLNTIIRNDKKDLSRGEIQKIVLARCLMKDAKVYIFDEPTSALDIKNEQEIIKKIVDYLKHKTVIIITHRITPLKYVDKVITMKKGKANYLNVKLDTLSEQDIYKIY